MNKNILTALLVLLVIVSLCACAAAAAVGGFLLFRNQQAASPTPPSSPTAAPTGQPTATTAAGRPVAPTPLPTATQAQSSETLEIPDEIAAQMDEIEDQVERLRGLDQRVPVARILLTPEQLRERLIQDFEEENDEQTMEDDLRVLSVFGLIDFDFDLHNFYIDLLTEQVAGYYDDETKEMIIVQGMDFDGPERLTYAHEFTHALQDQQYDLRAGLGLDEQRCEADSEYCAAVQALVEGDATLTEQYWLYAYGSPDDRQQIDDFYRALQSPIYDTAPEFLKEDIAFPYSFGSEFVLHLFEQGGYEVIDAAYFNPPVSTEQILHPERYPDDSPISVFMPDHSALPGFRLREVERGVVGEWYTYLILAKGREETFRIDESQALKAAEGWGGDAYAVYLDDISGKIVLAVQWQWDTTRDANEFADALDTYGRLRWGEPTEELNSSTLIWQDTPDGAVIIQRGELTTSWVIAPNRDTANRLLQSLTQAEFAGVE
jgi:hypothetical protein